MAIFSRRIIQRCLNENRSFLTSSQIEKHLEKLNTNRKYKTEIIQCEWEVIILNVLSKIGSVEHEKIFNNKTPDIYFQFPNEIEFVADITAISDQGLKNENPVDYFLEKANHFFKRRGILPNKIYIKIDGDLVGKYGDQKVKILLPPKDKIPKYIKNNFNSFVETILSQPEKIHKELIDPNGYKIEMLYDPQSRYAGASFLSYTPLYSYTKNPVYTGLKRKAKQLKNCEYSGILGIFICDGGYTELNSRWNSTWISQDDIIDKFFRENSSISFILMISVEQDKSCYLKLYTNANAKFPVPDHFSELLQPIAEYLPNPQATSRNALYWLEKHRNEGRSYYGGYSMTYKSIKISARTFANLLAGQLSFDKFNEDYFLKDSLSKQNFFKKQVEEGRMITKIEIEKCEDNDDDWIIIEFGDPDSAISPYH